MSERDICVIQLSFLFYALLFIRYKFRSLEHTFTASYHHHSKYSTRIWNQFDENQIKEMNIGNKFIFACNFIFFFSGRHWAPWWKRRETILHVKGHDEDRWKEEQENGRGVVEGMEENGEDTLWHASMDWKKVWSWNETVLN